MFIECRQYLTDRLQEAGFKYPVLHSYKKLAAHQSSHVGGVLFEKETYQFNGSKRIFTDQNGRRQKRTCYFDRKITFIVVIGEFSAEVAEEIFIRFLMSLGAGLYVDGNFTALEIGDVEWSEDADSSLKAKVQRLVSITFSGFVFKDTPLTKLTGGIKIRVEKVPINRKEQTNGSSKK